MKENCWSAYEALFNQQLCSYHRGFKFDKEYNDVSIWIWKTRDIEVFLMFCAVLLFPLFNFCIYEHVPLHVIRPYLHLARG